jgi:hypothetical protein
MATAPVDLDVQAPLLLFGSGRPNAAAGERYPREFIQEILARRTKYDWNQERTIAYIAGCLRGPARRWFHSVAPAMAGGIEAWEDTKKNLPKFLEMYQKHFNTGDLVAETELNRGAIDLAAQRPNEESCDYMDRIISAAWSLRPRIDDKAVAVSWDNRCMRIMEESTPDDIAYMKGMIEGGIKAGRAAAFEGLIGELVRKLIRDGTAQRNVRTEAIPKCDERQDMEEYIWHLKSFVRAQQGKIEGAEGEGQEHWSSNGNNNNRQRPNKKKGKVQATVVEDTLEEDDDDAGEQGEVNKVQKKQKSNSKKKADNQKPAEKTGKQQKKSFKCDFCGKMGHRAEKCFAKEYFDKKGQAQTAATDTQYQRNEGRFDPLQNGGYVINAISEFPANDNRTDDKPSGNAERAC